ncbi:hypothetical protein D3C80_2064740 [compost metagenome]
MLHGFDCAPASFVKLVTDAEIKNGRTFRTAFLNHQPEQQFTGARICRKVRVNGAELADHVVALA